MYAEAGGRALCIHAHADYGISLFLIVTGDGCLSRCIPSFLLLAAVVSEYHLTKLAELWNHTADDGYIYFGFRPPWVRRRAEESFLALHPELAAPAKLLTANAADANRKQITADDTQKLIGNTSSSSNGAANTARSGNGTSTASSGVQNTAPLPPASVGSRSSLPPR